MVLTAPTLRLELFAPGVDPAAAFDLLVAEWTDALGSAGMRFESGPSGRLAEVDLSGTEREFARVTTWEPGRKIAFSWQPVHLEQDPAPVPVEYTFEAANGGTRIRIEYGEWPPSTPLAEAQERIGWVASEVLPHLIRATAPQRFGDWWTDRAARRPSGPAARKTYADPLYHRPNFRLILERLHLSPDDRLLEVGCGGGAFLHDALASGCRAWAVDHSLEMVRLARSQNQVAIDEGRADIRQADVERLPFPDASCSCAVTTGSFSFWERPVVGLAEIRRVLEPGGRFILFTGTNALRGTPAAPEPVASRAHWYEDDKLAAMAREAGFVDVQVDRPNMGRHAREAGLPADAVEFFESNPAGGQVLQARRPTP
jgi:SAM-dependent methyltransferase